ncbi:MAG: NAD(P)H-dependent oxidoreductase [Actinomycetota bacterium]|nr:NAD(P)H-dependent oxidoreductase [Actinomycetota bacterium]
MNSAAPPADEHTALIVSGSPARHSHTRALAERMAESVQAQGLRPVLIDLAENPPPMVDLVHYWSDQRHPDEAVAAWIEQVRGASAVVLATPVQHASYSGLLKSALDLLPADALEYTPVCVAAHAGGAKGSTSACEHLRTVVKALAGWMIPTQVTTVGADFEVQGSDRSLVNKAALFRCEAAAEELATFARGIGRYAGSDQRMELTR